MAGAGRATLATHLCCTTILSASLVSLLSTPTGVDYVVIGST